MLSTSSCRRVGGWGAARPLSSMNKVWPESSLCRLSLQSRAVSSNQNLAAPKLNRSVGTSSVADSADNPTSTITHYRHTPSCPCNPFHALHCDHTPFTACCVCVCAVVDHVHHCAPLTSTWLSWSRLTLVRDLHRCERIGPIDHCTVFRLSSAHLSHPPSLSLRSCPLVSFRPSGQFSNDGSVRSRWSLPNAALQISINRAL
jgi:hypothetical protein